MEPALESFLDGIGEQDNVVKLRAPAAPKNDNEEALQDGSGILDMRELARRYRETIGHAPAKVEAPALSTVLPTHILAPVVETSSQSRPALLIASIALGAVLLVCVSVVTTVVLLRGGSADSARGQQSMALVAQDLTSAEPVQADEALLADPVVVPEMEESPEAAVQAEVEAPVEIQEEVPVAVIPQAAPKPAPLEVAPAPVKKAVSPEPVAEIAKPKAVAPAPVAVVAEPAVVEEVSVPQAAPEATPAKEQAAGNCDEVACLLEGRACCGKAASKVKEEESSIDESRPDSLSRSDISAALVPVQGRLQSCGTRNEVTGAVTIKLQISADGSVRSSKVGSGSEEFQSCVSQTLQKAQFAQTQSGTTVSYPIILR